MLTQHMHYEKLPPLVKMQASFDTKAQRGSEGGAQLVIEGGRGKVGEKDKQGENENVHL